MQNPRRATCLLALAVLAGCSSRAALVGLQGEASYEGQGIERGSIEFIPVEQTPGASAGAAIAQGRYEIPARWGLLPNGVYQVRITGYRKTGRMMPRAPGPSDRSGPPAEVQENFIPPQYNLQSTLKVRIADLSDKSHVDFRLGKKD